MALRVADELPRGGFVRLELLAQVLEPARQILLLQLGRVECNELLRTDARGLLIQPFESGVQLHDLARALLLRALRPLGRRQRRGLGRRGVHIRRLRLRGRVLQLLAHGAELVAQARAVLLQRDEHIHLHHLDRRRPLFFLREQPFDEALVLHALHHRRGHRQRVAFAHRRGGQQLLGVRLGLRLWLRLPVVEHVHDLVDLLQHHVAAHPARELGEVHAARVVRVHRLEQPRDLRLAQADVQPRERRAERGAPHAATVGLVHRAEKTADRRARFAVQRAPVVYRVPQLDPQRMANEAERRL